MNLRTRVMIIGGVVGALLGVGAAYLYLQSTSIEVDEEGRERLPAVQPGKAITASVGVLTTLKQVAGMGKA
ncbi:MAG: hypothetical protein KAW49_04855 [Anaerolineae bacterium]|nr:hypothetical protein [Chloroflexota bacterium]MCK4471097.1 hypothetical protein [Anaerolineae bacterium]